MGDPPAPRRVLPTPATQHPRTHHHHTPGRRPLPTPFGPRAPLPATGRTAQRSDPAHGDTAHPAPPGPARASATPHLATPTAYLAAAVLSFVVNLTFSAAGR